MIKNILAIKEFNKILIYCFHKSLDEVCSIHIINYFCDNN